MRPDRRRLLQMLLAMSLGACGSNSTAEGTLPYEGAGPGLKTAGDFKDLWARYRVMHVSAEGHVIDNGNGGISHSEGQGYGMLLALFADDRETFSRLHTWAEDNLARGDTALFSWRYDPSRPIPVTDPNNATDGDILIAWALMEAGRRWGDAASATRSQEIRTAIAEQLVVRRAGRTLLLPGLVGFDKEDGVVLNLSYYIWPALHSFAEAEGQGVWADAIRDGYWLLEQSGFGPLRLPTDWVALDDSGEVKPAAGWPPRFGFDAVRVPLYLLLQDPDTHRAGPIKTFWNSRIENGLAIPAWIDVLSGEVSDYALLPGARRLSERFTGHSANGSFIVQGQYYSDTIGLFTELIGS